MATKTYTTKAGDMWDMIAYTQMGSESYMRELLEANMEWAGYYRLPAGVVLTIPAVEKKTRDNLPPWRR